MTDQAFQDWIDEARSVSVLDAAAKCGAKLKRAGRDYNGPCPLGCCQNHGFVITPDKGAWLCRKSATGGGNSISLVMHCEGLEGPKGFLQACEILTGRPKPDGNSVVDPQAAQRRAERRKQAEREQRRQNEEDQRRAAYRADKAHQVWREGAATGGTMAEAYAINRGIEGIASIPSLRFHARVWNEDIRNPVPAMIGLVIGPDKAFKTIWRVFLKDGGFKADVPKVKKAYSSPKGGSVWIATKEEAMQPVWGVCEGIETALSIRQLFGLPVFAALSTSGMMGFEIPPHVKYLRIYPDGDIPTQLKNGGWNQPPGMNAARKLAARLKAMNFHHEIVEPPMDGDFNDILFDARKKGLI